jgi:hypothetical protein
MVQLFTLTWTMAMGELSFVHRAIFTKLSGLVPETLVVMKLNPHMLFAIFRQWKGCFACTRSAQITFCTSVCIFSKGNRFFANALLQMFDGSVSPRSVLQTYRQS